MKKQVIAKNLNTFVRNVLPVLLKQEKCRREIFKKESLNLINSSLKVFMNLTFMFKKQNEINQKLIESEIKEEEFIEILAIIEKRIILNTQFSVEEKIAAINNGILLEYIDMNPYFSLEEYMLIADLENLTIKDTNNDKLLKSEKQNIIDKIRSIEADEKEANIRMFNQIAIEDYSSKSVKKSKNIIFLERILCEILDKMCISKVINKSYFATTSYFDEINSEEELSESLDSSNLDDIEFYLDRTFINYDTHSLNK